jgi:hypothetical protein
MLVLIHISDLSLSLKHQVYGQPLVLKAVVSHHNIKFEILLAVRILVALNTHNPIPDYLQIIKQYTHTFVQGCSLGEWL